MNERPDAGLPLAVEKLVALVADRETGLTREELIVAARVGFRGLHPRRLADLVVRAVEAGALKEIDGRLQVAFERSATPTVGQVVTASSAGAVRAIVVDLESMIRATSADPYTETRIYQIGARRIGTDVGWVTQTPSFTRFVELPDDTWEFVSPKVRERHATGQIPPVEALLELQEYCTGADLLVAYNGTEADFKLLADAYARERLPPIEATPVDAYYLALALWPAAPTHRLGLLADYLGIDRDKLSWHDAADDCELLERVLTHAAAVVELWSQDMRDLAESVCPDSPGWTLVRQLGTTCHRGLDRLPHGHREVAAIVSEQLSGHTPRRRPSSAEPVPVAVADGLRGRDGRVNPVLLAEVAHGRDTTRRPAQEEMTTALHRWIDQNASALIEAPTGTGKSFAILAASLDWLAGDPDRTAIVATHTKQLQSQLADDVATLDQAVPGLLQVSDLVKGQANRLSLRALITALADATAAARFEGTRPVTPNRFLIDPLFRELLLFLMLRLIGSTDVRDSWAAHSVDPVDVPAFFRGYCGPRLPVWLESLSQAANGEYVHDAATPLAEHTDVVREALTTHRLVLTNHALLLAHHGQVRALGAKTVLIVDEAHQLEDAATSALTAAVDYRAAENLSSELAVWVETIRAGVARDRLGEAVNHLITFLDHEQLPKVAARAFDAHGTGAGVNIGSRAVTLASAYAGAGGLAETRQLARLLGRLHVLCDVLTKAIEKYLQAHGQSVDFFDAERARALWTRCSELSVSVSTVVDDLDDLLGSSALATMAEQENSADAAARNSTDILDDEVSDDDLDDEDDSEDDVDAPGRPLGALPPGTSNRLVYAEELAPPRGGLRHYHFRIATSPVELGADETWQRFLTACPRTYYVSATLRVAGGWDFIRSRLGLPTNMIALALNTPFDLEKQAELVCFADFPSWAEHAEGAMRTVAHQLTGYSREVVRPVLTEGDRGGFDGGALVLTTARSTAGGISNYLASDLRYADQDTPVHSALVLGNARAVDAFTDPEAGGGVLVGTKGLWQGVDVPDENRLRLVWINKLPFAPFAAPLVEARRAAVLTRAEAAHAEDPEAIATESYYLPLAALQLRQAVGRLIRSDRHRGVIVISDRKLAGATALRRSYRKNFLGSLGDGLLRDDPETGESGGGNVVPMAEGWARIWRFVARHGLLDVGRAAELSTPERLVEQTLLPHTRRIRELAMTTEQVDTHRAAGTLDAEVIDRAATIGGLLRLSDAPVDLKPAQRQIIAAVAAGQNVLGLLPTGFGKSYCFQLPALVLPGVTIVVSPLVALMHDQALELNRSIGGAVRALVAPLRESSSRTGKTEVADQLQGRADHGIRMIYVSPERLCQRRFRELVREAVARGTVTRIALDEAHTVVQWDDFRPSMTRVEHFLAALRRDFALPVTALTATANHTVHAGLREGVFGLAPAANGGMAGEAAETSAGILVTVRENPIRPELAIFRRSMTNSGPAKIAELAEEVLEAIKDHAIFYCLTVREVVGLHARLRDYLGDSGPRVLRFHGRLTEAEKSSVMTEFREAPEKTQEGFAPLVIVATSAFGLGVNRPDVRTVFCVSAPTDLAALYQQIGRAGRDVAGKPVEIVAGESDTGISLVSPRREEAAPPVNAGLALLTTQGLRTVEFMAGSDLHPALLKRMGNAVLNCRSVVDPVAIGDGLIEEDVTAGHLSAEDARKSYTSDSYRAGVLRALTALASLGALEDLGDFPPYCAVKPGELLHRLRRAAVADVEAAAVSAILDVPVRSGTHGALRRSNLSVAALDRMLGREVPGYRLLAEDAAATWQLLADLHDRGELDVSAAPSRRLVTGVEVHTRILPPAFASAVSGKATRALAELRLLRDFFDDDTVCANTKFADYFGVVNLPEGCCSHQGNRCSACWKASDIPLGEEEPKIGRALATVLRKSSGANGEAAFLQRRLDDQVARLVWTAWQGVHPRNLYRALRGEDTYFNPFSRRRVRLQSGLVTSRYFGVNPGIRLGDIENALARLADEGRVVLDGNRWRDATFAVRDAARAGYAGDFHVQEEVKA